MAQQSSAIGSESCLAKNKWYLNLLYFYRMQFTPLPPPPITPLSQKRPRSTGSLFSQTFPKGCASTQTRPLGEGCFLPSAPTNLLTMLPAVLGVGSQAGEAAAEDEPPQHESEEQMGDSHLVLCTSPARAFPSGRRGHAESLQVLPPKQKLI